MRQSKFVSPHKIVVAIVMVVAGFAWVGSAPCELPPLIPREVLFGNPARTDPEISPDGKALAWLQPDSHGVLQVWVGAIGKTDARVVTADRHRGIRVYGWAWNSRTIIYLQDSDGDENWHLFAVDLSSGNVRDLTPWQGVRATVAAGNPKFPDQLLVTLNLRNRKLRDVYRVNLRNGAVELDTLNPGDVSGWLADDNMVVRAAEVVTPDGGTEIRVRDSANGSWRRLLKAGMEDSLAALDFSKDGRSLFLKSSAGHDTSHVVRYEIASGRETEIASSAAVDAGPVLINPTRHVVEAVAFSPDRRHWKVVDPAVAADFESLKSLSDGDLHVVSRDLSDRLWLVSFASDRGPIRFYAWNRSAKQGTFLFSHRPELEKLTLAEMKPITFAARDGMRLHGYLTLPSGLPAKNLPLVLYVHGGPWGRDFWGLNTIVQLLANRGYAVLQINYRGSAGYGKKYLHAGDHEWGLKMEDDLIDGLNWAVAQGIADPKKVAIYGGSYGGYAALAGAAFFPDTFRCAIDEFGPSNLFTLFATMPPWWNVDVRNLFFTRVGDPDKSEDRAYLTRASPLFSADKIHIPMLIAQGANDARVKPAESEQIVTALAKNHQHGTYVVYTDEGHGFARPENNVDFEARVERFLADKLGGRFEPMNAERAPGATAVVRQIGGVGAK
jgi:dipeptidyl aminopeptidase/acylaminoacyl peptidase